MAANAEYVVRDAARARRDWRRELVYTNLARLPRAIEAATRGGGERRGRGGGARARGRGGRGDDRDGGWCSRRRRTRGFAWGRSWDGAGS